MIACTESVVYLGKLWGWCLNGDRRHSWRWPKDWPREGPSYRLTYNGIEILNQAAINRRAEW